MKLFSRSPIEVGAITAEGLEELLEQAKLALAESNSLQVEHLNDEDPAARFIEFLFAAFTSGQAHVADAVSGEQPSTPDQWGWRSRTKGFKDIEWQPRGDRVGWVDWETVLLNPDAAYAAAQKLARHQGTPLSITSRTLWKRLAEKGWLVGRDAVRNTTKKIVAGTRRRVLRISVELLFPKSGANGAASKGETELPSPEKEELPLEADPNRRVNYPDHKDWCPEIVPPLVLLPPKTGPANSSETVAGSGSVPIAPKMEAETSWKVSESKHHEGGAAGGTRKRKRFTVC